MHFHFSGSNPQPTALRSLPPTPVPAGWPPLPTNSHGFAARGGRKAAKKEQTFSWPWCPYTCPPLFQSLLFWAQPPPLLIPPPSLFSGTSTGSAPCLRCWGVTAKNLFLHNPPQAITLSVSSNSTHVFIAPCTGTCNSFKNITGKCCKWLS